MRINWTRTHQTRRRMDIVGHNGVNTRRFRTGLPSSADVFCMSRRGEFGSRVIVVRRLMNVSGPVSHECDIFVSETPWPALWRLGDQSPKFCTIWTVNKIVIFEQFKLENYLHRLVADDLVATPIINLPRHRGIKPLLRSGFDRKRGWWKVQWGGWCWRWFRRS